MMTHYIESDPIDAETTLIIPHFIVEIEISHEDWGIEINKAAKLSHVVIRVDGDVGGVELTARQALLIWGDATIEAWESAAADAFDANQALADEADDEGDARYEQWRDDKMDAA